MSLYTVGQKPGANLRQHRTMSPAAVTSVFHARNALLKLEIHKGFLRFRAFF